MATTPITGPVAAEIADENLVTKTRKPVAVTPANLRMLSADVLASITERFGGGRIGALLDELCEAKCITNGGREIPDNRTRLAAATLVLAYMIGRPVERQEVVNVNLNADTEVGLLDRLKASPALRSEMQKLLDVANSAAPVVEG